MPDVNPITILVIDDHFVVRSGLVASLALEADMIVVAEGDAGEQLVPLFAQHQPRAVLLDVQLGKLNGIEALEQLMSQHPAAQVLVFTTSSREEDIYRALRAGARGYLLKTAPRAELLAAVRAVSTGARYLPGPLAERLADRMSQPELSPREREILQLLQHGKSNKEIGGQLFITEDTVKRHVSNVLQKLGVQDRAQAVAEATRRGLISLD
ncbi:MAG: response regulator transcription factor [Planctomycetes bacterium]|nr:response regulator transcription factor [Planctomycetota bacterium]